MVQRIKVIKMVLKWYFLENKSNRSIKDMVFNFRACVELLVEVTRDAEGRGLVIKKKNNQLYYSTSSTQTYRQIK